MPGRRGAAALVSRGPQGSALALRHQEQPPPRRQAPRPRRTHRVLVGDDLGPHQLHACQALLRYGEVELATAIARAFCDAVATAYAAGGDAFEHLSHEDGCGLGTGRYTWTAAVALQLMEELVDRDVE